MSVNSSVSLERKIEYTDPSGNYPKEDHSSLTNNFLSRISFLNLSSTRAGRYDQTINVSKPIKAWHRASKGTTDRFEGCLTKLFPELMDLSEKDLKQIDKKRQEF